MAIPDHFTTQFGLNFTQAAQQTQSRFRQAAIVEDGCTGEAKTHNLVGSLSATETTGDRLTRTVLQELETEARWVSPRKWTCATPDIPFDETLLAPTIMGNGVHTMAHAAEYARQLDKAFIEGLTGTNRKGKGGASPADIPSGNIIDVSFVGVGTAGAALGLTVDKILRAKRTLRENETYGDDAVASGVTLWGAMTAEMEEAILFLANASGGSAANRLFSSDFMPPTLDANGNISTFLGIKWLRSAYCPVDTIDSAIQYAAIWPSNGVYLDIWKDLTVRVDTRNDLNYATQFHSEYAFAASRVEDKRVVKIACKKV